MTSKLEVLFESLSTKVHEQTELSLFKEMPLSEISSASLDVDSEDALRARITDACNIFDRINKKDIDRYLGISSEGSKATFVNLMKHICRNEHAMISEEIEKPLGMVFLMRGYLVHRRNKSLKRALDYFQLSLPLSDSQDTWNKVLTVLCQSLELANHAIQRVTENKNFRQEEIDAYLQEALEQRMLRKHQYILDDNDAKPIILQLMSSGPLSDKELASQFKLDIFNLRVLLLGLAPHVIEVNYKDMESTELQVASHALPILKTHYFGNTN